ncbi:MAG: hypothetical protein A2902_04275 [Elusimicrobia bacterium RIFCSPLOWO2_01_FULL_64_13]|nr:MAG: hypothetical protein A2636_05710 [Elusimicrobia bacterium RIFCSPHIGHO2_01_FULL_64_10]OGR95019.1 MAG: hypothetical protein A2902_04275 [Elusimicrobia bacterium RIFCSPLOWO2_01_FULL_64_13]
MIQNDFLLYLIGFAAAAAASFAFSPLFRIIAVRFNVMDHPNTSVKTHRESTPYLGGCAIALGFILSLICTRFLSTHPIGSLLPIQGIFLGGGLILILGLVDDTVAGGLSFKEKFAIQFFASAVLIVYGIQINFIQPRWLAWIVTVVWVTGVMNAINIIDIMDGLAGGISMIVALAFLFISLPTEQIYVNITSACLAGSVAGFLPVNLSSKRKMFMGDTGSLFIGFVLAALSLGTQYTGTHNAAIIAPILILGVPLYDTFFVMLIRYRKGISPFLGSRDHFALRLEKMGFTRPQIVFMAVGASLCLGFAAWLTTRIWFWYAVALYAVIFTLSWFIGIWLARVNIEK